LDRLLASLQLIAALRRLDLVSVEQLRVWANDVGALDSSSVSAAVARLSFTNPVDVDRELTAILNDSGTEPMADSEAALAAAYLACERILDGTVTPIVGAMAIWRVARRVPVVEPVLRDFIGLASEWQDTMRFKGEYEADIREVAQTFVVAHSSLQSRARLAALFGDLANDKTDHSLN
jgi:hypothetical protein